MKDIQSILVSFLVGASVLALSPSGGIAAPARSDQPIGSRQGAPYNSPEPVKPKRSGDGDPQQNKCVSPCKVGNFALTPSRASPNGIAWDPQVFGPSFAPTEYFGFDAIGGARAANAARMGQKAAGAAQAAHEPVATNRAAQEVATANWAAQDAAPARQAAQEAAAAKPEHDAGRLMREKQILQQQSQMQRHRR